MRGGSRLPPVETSPRMDENEDFQKVTGTVRMKGTVHEWKQKGGENIFVDGLSKYFGLEKENIKIIAIRQGSIVVDYEITVRKNRLNQIEDL